MSVIDYSVIVYSNDSNLMIQKKFLSVNHNMIKQFGAVSNETILEMAIALHEITNADICVVVSGIAGPLGGSIIKLVVTLCIGTYKNKETMTYNIYISEKE